MTAAGLKLSPRQALTRAAVDRISASDRALVFARICKINTPRPSSHCAVQRLTPSDVALACVLQLSIFMCHYPPTIAVTTHSLLIRRQCYCKKIGEGRPSFDLLLFV